MNAAAYGWLVLLTPLLGLAFNIALGRASRAASWPGGVALDPGRLRALAARLHRPALARRLERAIVSTGWHWLSGGSFHVDASILVDPLSTVMLLVITGVGFLIHAYSVGYMDGDAEEKRFFAYLNFFVFSMLLLVLAGNFVFLLVGWGLVGLSSYLLIGFWWHRPSAVAAAKKAFIMNAIGDVGMTLGIFVIWNTCTRSTTRPPSRWRPAASARAPRPRTGSRCCCWSARSPSRRSCRCRPGCPTPWRARRRSRR